MAEAAMTDAGGEAFTWADKARAWSVHLYTALGLPLAWLCGEALAAGDAQRFFIFQWIACVIDATDGFLARRWRVKDVTPGFSGRRLDDIVDYIHFTALPLAALPALDLVPHNPSILLVIPLMASAYGFCQELAKTEDSFVGFPSYWNILVLYLYVLGAAPKIIFGSMLLFSALVFVPWYWVYPSKTKRAQVWTTVLGFAWAFMVMAIMLRPNAAWAKPLAWGSLYFPVWYCVVSAFHHRDVMRRMASGEPTVAG